MEIELKLLVNSQGAEVLRLHPLLTKYATSKPHQQRMTDTYFDTPDLHIRRCDAGLRVRRVANSWIQTFKSGGSVTGGLHTRHEWESPVTGPLPDLAALRDLVDSPWNKMLRSSTFENHLLPIFTVRVTRSAWQLYLPQGDHIECVLDQGFIQLGNKKVPVREIELELKSGEPTHLFDFALALQQDIPMQIGNLSKADRGYALFAPQPPVAVKATPLKLTKHMTIEQAFQAIAVNCMAQIQSNEAGVVQQDAAENQESLHQMRVGLRRLRCAIGLFKDLLHLPEDLQEELNWLTAQLGPARDWDVLAGVTLPSVAEALLVDEPLLSGLKLAARRKAGEMHEAASAAVGSSRYTRLILCFTRWVQSGGWRDTLSPQDQNHLTERVRKFARKVLWHAQRRLLQRGKKLHGADPISRHRVRIAAKKSRYATEFFESLSSSKRVWPYVAALSALQDELGWLNDAAVADRLLKELQNEQSDLEGIASFTRGYLAARIKNGDLKIRKRWKKFVLMKLPC